MNDDVLNQENEAGRMGRNRDVERDADDTARKDDRSIFKREDDDDIEDGDEGDIGTEEAYR